MTTANGSTRPWAEEQLALDRLREEDLFNPQAVRRLWDQLQDGRRDRARMLWAILMFQASHKAF